MELLTKEIVLGPFKNQPEMHRFLMDTTEGCDVLIDQTVSFEFNNCYLLYKLEYDLFTLYFFGY